MEKEQIILHSAQEANILPLTSCCDAKCVFCSHHQNPSQVRVVSISPRTLAEVERTLSFLDGGKKITVGESATNIVEGEPFSHPRFCEVIRMVRKKFPGTLISITTNGHGLNEKMVYFLKEAEPVELNLSLNSASVKGRSILMGDKKAAAEETIAGVKLLHSLNVSFHGSIVAMPHFVGWEDIAETVFFLAQNGALTIRVFMPGYSRNAAPELCFDPFVMHGDLVKFVDATSDKISCPLLLEPPALCELTPVVAGVIKGSKADAVGLKRGDVVQKVNGLVPRSRVEAWHHLQQPGNIHALISRNGKTMDFKWRNDRGEKAGMVMEYDFDMKRMEEMKRIICNTSGSVLLLCSVLAFNILKAVRELMDLTGNRVTIQPVKNKLFGGSIGAAGLLAVSDFVDAFSEYRSCHSLPDLLMVPREAFDYKGFDLTGHSFYKLEEMTGVKVKIG